MGILRTSHTRSSEKFAVGVSDEVEVSAGEVVVLAKYSGTEVKIEGKNTRSWTPTTSSA
jgi:co-chaperonin GroES (HSP10)